jgi:hypothetical protein
MSRQMARITSAVRFLDPSGNPIICPCDEIEVY